MHLIHFKSLRHSRVCAVTLLSLASTMLFASEPTDTTNFVHNLDELEVTAASTAKTVLSTAPSYNLSDKKMKDMGVTDLTDALHRMPGLNIRDYGGAGGMKTVSARGFGDTHTGVIYDGVVISDCQSGRIDISRYSLDNIGNVSLVIGDNSDIFIPAKSAASAALITMSSIASPTRNDSAWHFIGQLKLASFGTISPYIRIAKRVNSHLSLSAIGEFTHAKNNYPFKIKNGIVTTRERRENSMMNTGHGELNLTWEPSAGNTFYSKIYYYDNDRQLPGPVIIYNPICNQTLRDRNFFGQVSFNNNTLRNLTFQLLGKFNWDASLYHDEDGKYPGGILNENYYQREVYISGIALYKPIEKLDFVYAADYSFNNMSSNLPNEPHPRRNSFLQSLTAKFKNNWLLATARLIWSVYDNEVRTGESAEDVNRLSPSVSFSIKPIHNQLLFLRTSYKNIFRMPTFNESYFYHLGSTSLKPEDTQQFNIGLTYQTPWCQVIPFCTFTADVYFNRVKDKIVAIPQNMFIWHMTNLDKVHATGLDLMLDVTMELNRRHSLMLSGNYSYQRVKPKTHPGNPDYNKQVAYTPVHSGAASLTWKNPWLNVVFHTTGASERYGTNTNIAVSRISGYMDCGVGLYRSFSIKKHNLDLRADLLNIFNKQYEIVAEYPMPGISWKLTFSYNF